jgi:hypothetical protein
MVKSPTLHERFHRAGHIVVENEVHESLMMTRSNSRCGGRATIFGFFVGEFGLLGLVGRRYKSRPPFSTQFTLLV